MFRKTYDNTNGKPLTSAFLSDKGLLEVLDGRPIVCSDVLLTNTDKKAVYLAKRKHKPAEGYWVIGGQRKRGESAEATACRRFKAETGQDISDDRLSFLGVAEWIWDYRSEPIQENVEGSGGRHDINYIFSIDCTDKELAAYGASLNPDEYDMDAGLTEFCSVQQLVDAGVRSGIIDYYKATFPKT